MAISPEARSSQWNPLPAPAGAINKASPPHHHLHQEQVMHLPQHQVPVQERHHIGFHEVHGTALFALIEGEGLQRLSCIVKLGKNHSVVASYQWTRGVAIILQP